MRNLSPSLLIFLLASAWVEAQPTPPPATDDASCEDYPREEEELDLSHPDAEGFHALFNGVDFDGWWLNCLTASSAGSTSGPVFRVDPVRKAIYSTERTGGIGGVLMTRAKFQDYEIVFDYWPDWGNDAALENRATYLGKAFNIPLGYLASTAIGGTWGQAGLVSRDIRPLSLRDSETTVIIPAGGNGWTAITRASKLTESVPCPESGCTQEDWQRLWDPDGWNQIRVVFHGGKAGDTAVHAKSWFRKLGAAEWVPLSVDTTLKMVINPGYIGFLVHGHGRYRGPRGTWYRNIRWRPWPVATPTSAPGASSPAARRPAFRVEGQGRALRLVFAEATSAKDIRVLSLDGRPIAHLRGIRHEAALDAADWRPGIHLVGVEADGRRDWTRILLP